jgi:hypothetical protein
MKRIHLDSQVCTFSYTDEAPGVGTSSFFTFTFTLQASSSLDCIILLEVSS